MGQLFSVTGRKGVTGTYLEKGITSEFQLLMEASGERYASNGLKIVIRLKPRISEEFCRARGAPASFLT